MTPRLLATGPANYLSVTHLQWAVGAGFFHSEELALALPGGSYRRLLGLVYDCGSNRSRAVVEREVLSFKARQGNQLDLLFISHFDKDHVSGLPIFAQHQIGFRQVIAPLLTPGERLIAFARTVTPPDLGTSPPDPAFDEFFRQLTADPAEALRAVAEQVEMVEPPAGELEGDTLIPEPLPILDPPGEEGEDPTRDFKLVHRAQERAVQIAISREDAQDLGIPIWEFRYHVLRKVSRQTPRFLARLAIELGMSYPDLARRLEDPKWILSLVTNSQNELRRSYDSLRGLGTRNDTSLCLYSGPAVARQSFSAWRSRAGHAHPERPEVGCWNVLPGWLGAGDAPLVGAQEVQEFNMQFVARKSNVGYLALPHHGSRRNHNDLIFDGFDSPPNCVLGADGQYGHPHQEVLLSAARRGSVATIVTNDVASRSVESCTIRFR